MPESSDQGGGLQGPPPAVLSAADEAEKKRIAQLEIENGFRQFDYALDVIRTFLDPERPFALRTSLLLDLQRIAVEGLEKTPGQFRTTEVKVTDSRHTPPGPHLVRHLSEEMCDYVNNNWHERSAFHLSAYVMWRLNWIHPFSDGNGRTSRMISYVVLCTRLRTVLPGSPSIPQQIQDDRTAYFRALEYADDVFEKTGQVDVSHMETALKNMLAKQLLSVIQQADGGVIRISN